MLNNRLTLIAAALALASKIVDLLRQLANKQPKQKQQNWEQVAREIAKKHGIDEEIFVAVLYCESNMNPNAVNRNPNGTTDYGICQFNDYWYRDIITPDTALNQPEVALNVMAEQWKAGRTSDWICYRKGRYISFLRQR